MPIGGFGLGFSSALGDYMTQERARARKQEDDQIDYHMELIKALANRPDINQRPEIMGQAIHDMMELANAKGGKGKQSKGMAGFMGGHDLPVSQFLSGLVSGARPTVGPTEMGDPETPAEPVADTLSRLPQAPMIAQPPPVTPVGVPTPQAPTGGKDILEAPVAMPPVSVAGPPEASRMISAGRGIQSDAVLNPPKPMPAMRTKPVPSAQQPYFISPEERAAQAGDIKRTENAKTRTQEAGERMLEGQKIGLEGAELRDYALTGRIPTGRPTADIQNFEYAKAQGQQPLPADAQPGMIPPPPVPATLRDYQQQKANDKKPVVKPPTAAATAVPTTTPIKNYEYAKAQGYTGTFQQWQKDQANNKTVQPKAAGGSGGQAGGALTPDAVEMYAQSVAKGGPMPALGMGAGPLRAQIMNRAAAIYKGLDLVSQQAAFKANQASLVKLQPQADALEAFSNTAGKNLAQFLQQAQKIVSTGSPLINTPLRAISANIMGDPNMAAFNAARTVVLPEFARIIANPNMTGALSDSARKEIEGILNGNATLAQITNVTNILMQDAANRRTSTQEQIRDIKSRISAAPGSGGVSSPEQELMNFLKGGK